MNDTLPQSPPVERIPLDWIKLPRQRHYFGTSHLDEIAQAMRVRGLADPILVTRAGDTYEIIDGKRRLFAARLLGWRSIDARIV